MEKILWWRLPKLLIETLSAYSSLQLMSGLMYFLGVKTFLNIFKYSFSAIFNNVSPLCLSSKSLLLSSISDFRWDSEKKWMRQEWKEKMNLDGNNCKWTYLIAHHGKFINTTMFQFQWFIKITTPLSCWNDSALFFV